MSLEGTWPVYEDGRQVGTCTVARQGLYLRFDCRCGPADGRILRLVLRSPAFDILEIPRNSPFLVEYAHYNNFP